MNTRTSVLTGFLAGLLTAAILVGGLVIWWDPAPSGPINAFIHNPATRHAPAKPRPPMIVPGAPPMLAPIPAALAGTPPQEVWLPRKLSDQQRSRRTAADRALLQLRILAGARMMNITFFRNELGNGEYDPLESQLDEALGKELADPRYEAAVQNIVKFNEGQGFTSDEEKPLIDAWVKQRPQCVWAHYAEAVRWYDMGWKSRDDVAAVTDLAKSHQDFVRARDEAHKALKINPSVPNVWEILLLIDRSDRSLDAVKQDYRDGLSHIPRSGFMLQSAYQSALSPEWYGSYDEMEEFARQVANDSDLNPRLWALQGEPYGERGCIHCNHLDWQTGLKLLNQSLAYGDNLTFLDYAGESAMHLHRYALAYQYYQRASFYGGDEKVKYLMAMGLMQSRCDPKVSELRFMDDRNQVDTYGGFQQMDYPRVPGDCTYYQAELPWGDEPPPDAGDIKDGYDLNMEHVMASFKKKH
ncbi:MAG TPA: hypothetical protein VGH91_10030 [Gammaproteobacteria bacterium]